MSRLVLVDLGLAGSARRPLHLGSPPFFLLIRLSLDVLLIGGWILRNLGV